MTTVMVDINTAPLLPFIEAFTRGVANLGDIPIRHESGLIVATVHQLVVEDGQLKAEVVPASNMSAWLKRHATYLTVKPHTVCAALLSENCDYTTSISSHYVGSFTLNKK